ncbi:hypothetical protein [Kribbella sp. NPDC049584]|uniref:hypothetical protein n=1 Tax=Kribbella sp. NPDC049584 TaxID=3154833 RepID=UPI00343C294B
MKVERAIKALLRDLHPGLRSLEGSGGDGGRDAFLVEQDGTMCVFEIKSYARPLNNGQKKKIEHSLRNALTHDRIGAWVLVLPHDHTPTEETWFDQKIATIAAPVTVQWLGRDWLDKQFAPRGDLQRYVEGPDSQLLKRAQQHSMEQAVLAGGLPDLAQRQTALGQLADELSPFWRIEPATVDGQTTIQIRPKRPDFPDDDPVAVDVRFGAASPADRSAAQQAQTAYEQVVAFGGQIAIDRRYLDGIDITASTETASLFGNLLSRPIQSVELSTPSEPTAPLTGQLEAISSANRITASARIIADQRRRGIRGTTLYARDESGGVSLAIPVPDQVDPGHPAASMRLTVGPFTGCQPDTAQHVLAVLLAAGNGDRLQVRFGRSLKGLTQLGTTVASLPDLHHLAELVADLITVQDHTGRDIAIPGDCPVRELEALNTIARAIRGERVRLSIESLSFELHADRVDEFLAVHAGRPESGMVINLDGQLDLTNTTYPLGPISYHAPNVVLANHAELLAGNWDGQPVARYTTSGGEGIYLLPIPTP